MPPCPNRVAARWLNRPRLASEDINLPALSRNLADFDTQIRALKADHPHGNSPVVRAALVRQWSALVRSGFGVVNGVLSTRSIPTNQTKSMEMAYRLLANSSRQPKDMYKWWEKNQKRFDLLVDAAKHWPEKQLGTDELFELGSFTIHNTVGASGTELEGLKKAMIRAEQRIKTIPWFRKVLYGDVHIVANISRAHHAAWYRKVDDSVYLRRSKRAGMGETHALIHELGHRYWTRFASGSQKREWELHHERTQSNEVRMPEVGDPLPVKIKGMSDFPTVRLRMNGTYVYAVPKPDGTESMQGISEDKIRRYLTKNPITNFPTTYSSTNAEEHFCEALTLAALNDLDAEHLTPFNTIWNA